MARVQFPSARTVMRADRAMRRNHRQWHIATAAGWAKRDGRITKETLAWLRKRVPLSERQLRRLIANGGYEPYGFVVTVEAYSVLQDHGGNIAAAADKLGIPRSTLADAITRDLSRLDTIQMDEGDRERSENELRLQLLHEFGACWQSDIKYPSVDVIHPLTGEICEPAVMHTKCPASRVIVGHHCSPDRFKAQDIIDGMDKAMEVYEEHGPFGGTPDYWQLDNAGEHKDKKVIAHLDDHGIRPTNILPYSPQANGSVESFHALVESRYSAAQRFYRHRATEQDGKTPLPAGGSPMQWNEFLDSYETFIDAYNFGHVHSVLNSTPATAWGRLAKDAEE